MIKNGVVGIMFSKGINYLRNAGPGYKLALASSWGFIGWSLYFGKRIESQLMRWGLAGTSSTLLIEFCTFGLSTLDMNAKTTTNFNMIKYFKTHGVGAMFKGLQPYVYGNMMSSLFYYYLYKDIKELIKKKIRKNNYNEKSVLSVAMMSAGASAIWELVAISFYYPFDLIKARMQRSENYHYKNTTDGLYQIFKSKSESYKIFDYYKGAGIYTLSYGLFTILEFTFYETILVTITNWSKRKGYTSEQYNSELSHAKQRNLLHVIISSFLSGALSAIIVNPLELTVWAYQNSKGKSITQVIKGFKSIRALWQGVHFSILYFGTTTCLLFVVLEKMWEILDWQISEAD
jgi:hypothetical protein